MIRTEGERLRARTQLAFQIRSVRNLPFPAIAAELTAAGFGPCTPEMVADDIQRAYAMAGELLAEESARDRMLRATRYEYIIQEAMTAWHASKAGKQLGRSKSIKGREELPAQPAEAAVAQLVEVRHEEVMEVRSSHGDERYLLVALHAMAAKAKMLGTEEPARGVGVEAGPEERAFERQQRRYDRLMRLPIGQVEAFVATCEALSIEYDSAAGETGNS